MRTRLVSVRVLPRRGIIDRSGQFYSPGEEAELPAEQACALIESGIAETVMAGKSERRPTLARLVRFDPFREVAALQNDMSRLLGALREEGGTADRNWIPALDVWETDNEYIYAFDLPGIPEDEINIEFEDGVLTVSAQRERSEQIQSDRVYRHERRFGSFTRSLGLPQGIKDDDITATHQDGVLEIHVKKPEEVKPRRIQISVGSSHPSTIEGTATTTT